MHNTHTHITHTHTHTCVLFFNSFKIPFFISLGFFAVYFVMEWVEGYWGVSQCQFFVVEWDIFLSKGKSKENSIFFVRPSSSFFCLTKGCWTFFFLLLRRVSLDDKVGGGRGKFFFPFFSSLVKENCLRNKKCIRSNWIRVIWIDIKMSFIFGR